MNTIHDFHASVESISQLYNLWNLFHQVRNEGHREMRELFSQLWNLFHQVIYRNKFHIGAPHFLPGEISSISYITVK
jgi:hypothetical protein